MKINPLFAMILFSGLVSAGIGHDVNVQVVISKRTSSGDIEIVAANNNFMTLYDVSSRRFDNVVVPFSVRSPLSAADNYSINLTEAVHYCELAPLAVQLELDGVLIEKGDTVADIYFDHFDATNKWRDHQLSLSFPEIYRDVTEIQCHGLVGITVELDI